MLADEGNSDDQLDSAVIDCSGVCHCHGCVHRRSGAGPARLADLFRRRALLARRAPPQANCCLVQLGPVVADPANEVIGLRGGQPMLAREISQFVALVGSDPVAIRRAAFAGIVRHYYLRTSFRALPGSHAAGMLIALTLR